MVRLWRELIVRRGKVRTLSSHARLGTAYRAINVAVMTIVGDRSSSKDTIACNGRRRGFLLTHGSSCDLTSATAIVFTEEISGETPLLRFRFLDFCDGLANWPKFGQSVASPMFCSNHRLSCFT